MADIIINESSLYTKANNTGVSYTDLASPNNRTASPNYCPTKSNISSQVSNSIITGTYANNQLVCDKDVFAYTAGFYTGLSYGDVPASGSAINIATNPCVRFNVNGTSVETIYPSTTYGTWSFNKQGGTLTLNTSNGQVSASNLGTTTSSRTAIGTVACIFTAKPEYGNWAIGSVAGVYQQANSSTKVIDSVTYGTPTETAYSGSITAAGGTRTYTANVQNTRYYHYSYTSGSVSSSSSETVYGTVAASLSASYTNNSGTGSSTTRFSLSSSSSGNNYTFKLTHSTMLTTVGKDSYTVTIYNSGDSSKKYTRTGSVTNEIYKFEDGLDLTFPPITFSGHSDVLYSESAYSTYGMGLDDVDPIYRRKPLVAKTFRASVTKLTYTSGYNITSPSTTYISRYSIYSGSTEKLYTTSTIYNNLLSADLPYNNFSYSTSSSNYYKIRTYSNSKNSLDLYTTIGNASENRSFTVTCTPSSLTSKVTIKGTYRANGNAATLSHTLPTLTKTFTQLNYGIITLNNTTNNKDYILFLPDVSNSGPKIYSDNSISWSNKFGVIGTGNGSTIEIPNYASMPISRGVYTQIYVPAMYTSNTAYVRVIPIDAQQGSNSYRQGYDGGAGASSPGNGLVLNPSTGSEYISNPRMWAPRADYTL